MLIKHSSEPNGLTNGVCGIGNVIQAVMVIGCGDFYLTIVFPSSCFRFPEIRPYPLRRYHWIADI